MVSEAGNAVQLAAAFGGFLTFFLLVANMNCTMLFPFPILIRLLMLTILRYRLTRIYFILGFKQCRILSHQFLHSWIVRRL